MFIKHKTKEYFLSLIDESGNWHGPHDDGKPTFVLGGKKVDAADIAKHLGVKISGVWQFKPQQSNKYRKQDDAGMGTTHDSRDTSDTGDGVSESQE